MGNFLYGLYRAVVLNKFVFDDGIPKIKFNQVWNQVRIDAHELTWKD